MSDLSILRRIAERGLKSAQRQSNSEMVDLWIHILDEIERTLDALEAKDKRIAELEGVIARYLVCASNSNMQKLRDALATQQDSG